MKIILCSWGSLYEPGLINAITRLGHQLVIFDKSYNDVNYDKDYFLELVKCIELNKDVSCVISANYIPIISRACKPFGIPYLSHIADCPCSTLYSKTLAYPHNRVFIFDKLQAEKFYPYNPGNIFHLTLASDTSIWDKISITQQDQEMYGCDISFVGSLYTEMCKYNRIQDTLPDKVRGFVDGLITAQQMVYGYYFIEDAITEDWAKEFQGYANLSQVSDDYVDDIKGIIANSYIGYKCTEQERINTFKAISESFNMDIWTNSDTSIIPNINNRGPADSQTMMPKIFKCSKININTTSRTIRSGIPLRIFDIMGCGGFVISNYQPELAELFVPGQDIVLYDSIPDLLSKIQYYLVHEDERLNIAKNGYEKVKQYHNHQLRLNEMLTMGLHL